MDKSGIHEGSIDGGRGMVDEQRRTRLRKMFMALISDTWIGDEHQSSFTERLC